MQETWVRSLRREGHLEEEMATHSIILAWEIPWREESGRLQSTGSQELDMTEHFTHALNIVNHRTLVTYTILYINYISRSSVRKESACSAGDPGSIPRLGRSLGEGNGNPLQSCRLENPMDRGAWRPTVHGVARVGHDLAAKLLPLLYFNLKINKINLRATWILSLIE